LLLGAGFVVLVLIADSRYRLQISGYGVALAATGLAAFGGTLAAPPLAHRYSPSVLVPAAFLPAAAAAYIGGLFSSLVVLVCCVSVVAFAFQVLKIAVDALIGGNTPDVVRGRVFAVYDVMYNVAFVAAGLVMVPLWRLGRERSLLWLIATGFVLGWLLVGVAMLGWRWRRSDPGPRRRGDLLRPAPPRGATRRSAARVPEFHLDIPGKLGSAAIGQPGRRTRRRGGPPGGARRVVGRQRGLRRPGPATGLVPVRLSWRDRGECFARIGQHRVPTAWGLGRGAGVRDPRRRRRPGYAAVLDTDCFGRRGRKVAANQAHELPRKEVVIIRRRASDTIWGR
jgi:hypothetical protein